MLSISRILKLFVIAYAIQRGHLDEDSYIDSLSVMGFSDADWAYSRSDMQYTFGYYLIYHWVLCFLLETILLLGATKKTNVVSHCRIEVEYLL